jgi:hypothetical protein
MMECELLIKYLEDMLINEILTPDNATHHYLDAIAFDSPKLQKACETIIFTYFDQIVNSDDGKRFLNKLPWVQLHRIVKSDKL